MMNMTVEHAKMKAQGLFNSLAKQFSSQMKVKDEKIRHDEYDNRACKDESTGIVQLPCETISQLPTVANCKHRPTDTPTHRKKT
jgi:hypothetical protein